MNNDTLVFRYAVSATDVDADGITLGENILHGYVNADLGSVDEWKRYNHTPAVPRSKT